MNFKKSSFLVGTPFLVSREKCTSQNTDPTLGVIGTNVREGKRGKSINFHRDSKHAMAHANFPAGINYSQIFTSYNIEFLNIGNNTHN